MLAETVTILLVEDDEVDAEGVRRAFARKKIANPIHHVWDGIEALEVLRKPGAEGGVQWPFVILLDLNLPRMGGIEFLDHLRKDERLHDCIVFVLTTSDDDKDKLAAYHQNVAGYILKSKVGEDFLAMVDLLDVFWRLIEFPPERKK